MKRHAMCWFLGLCLGLSACNPKEEAPAAKPAKSSGHDLALPVTAPMRAREHLRQEVRKINVAGQKRRRQLDSMDPNR